MSNALTFYTHPMSRGRVVRWMLEEVGQPYDTVLLDFATTAKAPDFLAINPMGKVPALTHGQTVVTETAAICAYLADAFPEAGLAPPLADRGAYYRWLFFAAGPLESTVITQALGFEVPADRRVMAGWGSHGDVLNALEIAVSQGEYIAGPRFTAADLYVGAHLGWGMQMGGVEARPAFKAYVDRLDARPAARRAVQIDDDLMKA